MKRDVFQGLADPTRREILVLLSKKPMTPNAMADHFDTSRQAVSKHIKYLAECALVMQQQRGREIVYHLNSPKMKEVDKWLEQFRKLWESRFIQLDKVLLKIKPDKK